MLEILEVKKESNKDGQRQEEVVTAQKIKIQQCRRGTVAKGAVLVEFVTNATQLLNVIPFRFICLAHLIIDSVEKK